MSKTGETFFTVIGCMDGRAQEPIRKFGQKKFGAEFPDTITEAGLAGLLAQQDIDPQVLGGLKKKIDISLKNHHSKGILVYGHADCAGNPVNDDKHRSDVTKSVEVVRTLGTFSVPVVGAFVKRGDEGWLVEEL